MSHALDEATINQQLVTAAHNGDTLGLLATNPRYSTRIKLSKLAKTRIELVLEWLVRYRELKGHTIETRKFHARSSDTILKFYYRDAELTGPQWTFWFNTDSTLKRVSSPSWLVDGGALLPANVTSSRAADVLSNSKRMGYFKAAHDHYLYTVGLTPSEAITRGIILSSGLVHVVTSDTLSETTIKDIDYEKLWRGFSGSHWNSALADHNERKAPLVYVISSSSASLSSESCYSKLLLSGFRTEQPIVRGVLKMQNP